MIVVGNGQDDGEEELADDDDIHPDYVAWSELRLQPQLMRSIYKLGFKEPTPIQKACIPAAAHQGKVCFSYPCLVRLLVWLWHWSDMHADVCVTGCDWCC